MKSASFPKSRESHPHKVSFFRLARLRSDDGREVSLFQLKSSSVRLTNWALDCDKRGREEEKLAEKKEKRKKEKKVKPILVGKVVSPLSAKDREFTSSGRKFGVSGREKEQIDRGPVSRNVCSGVVSAERKTG